MLGGAEMLFFELKPQERLAAPLPFFGRELEKLAFYFLVLFGFFKPYELF